VAIEAITTVPAMSFAANLEKERAMGISFWLWVETT